MNYTQPLHSIIYVYLSYFHEKFIKDEYLLLYWKEVESFQMLNDGMSFLAVNNEWESKSIDFNKILHDKDINFWELFSKHYKEFYPSEIWDKAFDKNVEKLLNELK